MYTFIADAGHGWLQVPINELDELGIKDKITSYSYQEGLYAYLEEDQDMWTFIKAKLGMRQDQDFKGFQEELTAFYGEVSTPTPVDYSRVRRMPRYAA